jgi:hypothetical protein
MIKICRILSLMLLFLPVGIRSQILIKNFVVQPANTAELLITWTVDGSSQACSDLELMWSTDSFQTTSTWVHTVPVICGTSGADESYYFQHTMPDTHGKNYYRLVSFGAPVSPIIVYDFGQVNGGYVIYPCPLNDNSVLTFKNPKHETWVLDISNAPSTERYIQYNITGEQTPLPLTWFKQTGMYYFRLYSSGGDLIKGKFVVMY